MFKIDMSTCRSGQARFARILFGFLSFVPWWSQDHGILVRILMHCALGSLTHGGLTHGGLRIMGSWCVY